MGTIQIPWRWWFSWGVHFCVNLMSDTMPIGVKCEINMEKHTIKTYILMLLSNLTLQTVHCKKTSLSIDSQGRARFSLSDQTIVV